VRYKTCLARLQLSPDFSFIFWCKFDFSVVAVSAQKSISWVVTWFYIIDPKCRERELRLHHVFLELIFIKKAHLGAVNCSSRKLLSVP
jgi:hypothetical protein